MAKGLNDKGVSTQQVSKWYPSVVWHLYRNKFYTGKSKSLSPERRGDLYCTLPLDRCRFSVRMRTPFL